MNTTHLKPYQVPHAAQMLRALETNRSALDASDTGTGKTWVALWLAGSLGLVPLVICPKSSIPSWEAAAVATGISAEIVNYEKVRGVRRTVLAASGNLCPVNGKQFLGPFTHRLSNSVWGHELKMGQGSRWQWHGPFGLVIFDEVHRCGGFTSLNSKLLVAARRQAEYVLCLSATSANDPLDLKALGYALRLFELRDYRNWLLRNGCKPGIWGGFDFVADPEKQKAVMQQIHKTIFPARGARMVKKDIPDFPRSSLSVKLIPDDSGKARRLTEDCADAFENNHLERRIRTRQALELLRLPAMVDLVEDYSKTSRVVVFLNYTRSIDEMKKRLEKMFQQSVGILDGRNTQGERAAVIKTFQSNTFPALVVNTQAGGTGCDLHDPTGQVERTSLISPCDNPKDMEQVLGRVHRLGGAFSQQFFVYFADTLEADIAAAVSRSMTNLAALNDAVLHGARI